MTKINDSLIRSVIYSNLITRHKASTNALIVEELSLCRGSARIDLAIITEHLQGYEIKSELDSLRRLRNQIKIYNKVMDKITIVTTYNHLEDVEKLVPEWWGINIVSRIEQNKLHISYHRRQKHNHNVDVTSILELLWKDEALSILEKHSLAKGMYNKSRSHIYKKLAEDIPLTKLKLDVNRTLMDRKHWRAVPLHR